MLTRRVTAECRKCGDEIHYLARGEGPSWEWTSTHAHDTQSKAELHRRGFSERVAEATRTRSVLRRSVEDRCTGRKSAMQSAT